MRTRRGILLLTTLCILTFIVMLTTMLVVSGYASLRQASAYSDGQIAQQAAYSGLAYAQAQASASLAWMAAGTTESAGTATAANETVVTFNPGPSGSVVGYVALGNGGNGRFLINFNSHSNTVHDGATLLACPYVSCNNLFNQNPVSNGVMTSAGQSETVPGQTLTIVCVGQSVDASGYVRAQRVAEANFGLGDAGAMSSSAFGAGNIDATIQPGQAWTLQQAQNQRSAGGMSTLGDIALYDTSGPSDFHANNANLYTAAASEWAYATDPGTNTSLGQLGTVKVNATLGATFPSVTSAQAYPSAGSGSKIEAGAYVFWPPVTAPAAGVTASTTNSWRYIYNLDYDPHSATQNFVFNPNGTVTVTDSTTGLATIYPTSTVLPPQATALGVFNVDHNGNPTTSFNNNVEVADINVIGETFTNDQNVAITDQAEGTPLTVMTFPSMTNGGNSVSANITIQPTGSNNSATLYASPEVDGTVRNMNLIGQTSGTGAVVSSGNLAFQGNSALNPPQGAGLAMYSGGNVTMEGNTNTAAANAYLTNISNFIVNSAYNSSSGLGVSQNAWQNAGHNMNSLINPYDGTSITAYLTNPAYGILPPNTPQNQVDQFIQNILNNNSINSGGLTYPNEFATATYNPGDQTFQGMVFAQGNFVANMGLNANLTIDGGLVAYGGNPNLGQAPGALGAGYGNIEMDARNITMIYDPSKLGLFAGYFGGGGVQLSRNHLSLFLQ